MGLFSSSSPLWFSARCFFNESYFANVFPQVDPSGCGQRQTFFSPELDFFERVGVTVETEGPGNDFSTTTSIWRGKEIFFHWNGIVTFVLLTGTDIVAMLSTSTLVTIPPASSALVTLSAVGSCVRK